MITITNATTFAFANTKGGVGKSLSVLMVARHLATRGYSVLAIDLDPRATLTGWAQPGGRHTIGDVLGGAANPTVLPRAAASMANDYDFAVIPSAMTLANVAHALHARTFNRIEALYNALNDGMLGYNIVLIDCPGAADVLMINGLYAADAVIIPSQPEAASIDAIDETRKIIRQTAQAKKEHIVVNGIITRADERANSHKLGIQRIQHQHGYTIIVPERKGADADAQLYTAYTPVADMIESIVKVIQGRTEAVHA